MQGAAASQRGRHPEDVFQLPHVSGPGVVHQGFEQVAAQCRLPLFPPEELLEKLAALVPIDPFWEPKPGTAAED